MSIGELHERPSRPMGSGQSTIEHLDLVHVDGPTDVGSGGLPRRHEGEPYLQGVPRELVGRQRVVDAASRVQVGTDLHGVLVVETAVAGGGAIWSNEPSADRSARNERVCIVPHRRALGEHEPVRWNEVVHDAPRLGWTLRP